RAARAARRRQSWWGRSSWPRAGAPLVIDQTLQVAPVVAARERRGEPRQLIEIDQPLAVGDLLRAGDLEALPVLDRLDEGRGRDQRLVRAGVEPGKAAPERLDRERAARKVGAVDVGDLELAARRGRQAGRDLDHARIVEIEAGDRIARLRRARLLLWLTRAARRV